MPARLNAGPTPSGTAEPRRRLAVPEGVTSRRIVWDYAITVAFYHLVALLALTPWFFSCAGLIVGVLGITVFGTLGINLCYHRMLTHRGLRCPRWFEHALAVLGLCCMQDTPARWVAVHRRHHEHSDAQPDPHSPLVNLLWGHVGWMLVQNSDLRRLGIFDRYAKDILRDPFYRRLERGFLYPAIILLSWLAFFLGGFAGRLLAGGSPAEAAQLGASVLVWGVFARTVAVWHITWSVNSLAHRSGYRSFDTDDDSRNNWFVALISGGEGWHNNHHADPRAASHGRSWREPDQTYFFIRIFSRMGLLRDVIVPNRKLPTLSDRPAPQIP
ncbi:MAG: fatty acid desaturase [Proteobacteria bacterium]|nr:fatty acid desaturase [Pseudomonadota bacterium]